MTGTTTRATVDRLEEQDWLRQAQAGDREAFSALVERHWPRVYRWLLGLTGNAHGAEDLTQDVFLKAWSALGSFRGETGFRAWLFRIAHNGFLDSRRGPRGKSAAPLPPALASRESEPSARVVTQEAQCLILEACARLPSKLRATFLLHTQEGLPFADIAKVFGISEETVRWRIFKARQQLLRELGPYLDGMV